MLRSHGVSDLESLTPNPLSVGRGLAELARKRRPYMGKGRGDGEDYERGSIGERLLSRTQAVSIHLRGHSV